MLLSPDQIVRVFLKISYTIFIIEINTFRKIITKINLFSKNKITLKSKKIL